MKNRYAIQTVELMRSARLGSLFICRNLDRGLRISHAIGRRDLEIHTPRWLTSPMSYGVDPSGIVLDNDVELNDDEMEAYEIFKSIAAMDDTEHPMEIDNYLEYRVRGHYVM